MRSMLALEVVMLSSWMHSACAAHPLYPCMADLYGEYMNTLKCSCSMQFMLGLRLWQLQAAVFWQHRGVLFVVLPL